jgi:endonuclease G
MARRSRKSLRWLGWLALALVLLVGVLVALSYVPEDAVPAGLARDYHRRLVDARTGLFGPTVPPPTTALSTSPATPTPRPPQKAQEPTVAVQTPSRQETPPVAPSGALSWAGPRYYGGMPRPAKDYPYTIKVLDNIGYSAGYCPERKTPAWVAYRIPKHGHVTSPKRPDKFTADRRVPGSPVSNDYIGSGYDRGHMAPNHVITICYGTDAQLETFLMTNIIPQRPSLNRQVWEGLESTETDTYGSRYDAVWVITGPVYDANVEKLGAGEEIPDACYRVVIREDGGRPVVLALEVPQTVTGHERPDTFLTSVDRIEADTRLDFMLDLPDDVEDRVEAAKPAALW